MCGPAGTVVTPVWATSRFPLVTIMKNGGQMPKEQTIVTSMELVRESSQTELVIQLTFSVDEQVLTMTMTAAGMLKMFAGLLIDLRSMIDYEIHAAEARNEIDVN